MEFPCGKEFKSSEELMKFIQEFQKTTYSVFSIRDSVSIECARKKKGIQRHLCPELDFYYRKFACIHGGKNFKSKSDGLRKSDTFKQNCPAYFKVIVNKSGDKLVISEVNLQHNHLCNKLLNEKLPQVRILAKEQKKEVRELLRLGANKRQIITKIQRETAKKPTMKDLCNILTVMKAGKNDPVKLENINVLKQELGMEEESKCVKRWTKAEYMAHVFDCELKEEEGEEEEEEEEEETKVRVDESSREEDDVADVSEEDAGTAICEIQVIDSNEKLKLAQSVAMQLALIVAESTGEEFAERLNILCQIKEAWSAGKEVLVATEVLRETAGTSLSAAADQRTTVSPAEASSPELRDPLEEEDDYFQPESKYQVEDLEFLAEGGVQTTENSCPTEKLPALKNVGQKSLH